MRNYLKIKNAIISFLVTGIYFSWLIKGLSALKMTIACVTVFICVFALLISADKIYININEREKRSEIRNENRK